jgi:hypothetical protein
VNAPQQQIRATRPGSSQARLALWWFRLLASTLVLLLVSAQAPGSSFALFRCAYTGVVLTSCCCAASELPDSTAPVLSKRDCCAVQHIDTSLPAGARSVQTISFAPSTPCLLLPPLRAPRSYLGVVALATTRPTRQRERSRAGPSLTIVNRRLLL